MEQAFKEAKVALSEAAILAHPLSEPDCPWLLMPVTTMWAGCYSRSVQLGGSL